MPAVPSKTRNRPVIFFALFLLAALAEFAILLAGPIRPFVDGFSGRLASFSAWLIGAFGGTCLHHNAVLSNPSMGFSMEVRDGCNGVNVVLLLWAAILAYPSNLKWKFTGLAGGLAAIQILNLFRLISLYYLGQYSPPLFEFAHLYLWETLIIIDAIVVFGIWSKRAAAYR
jgi:exosortase H (IPTLxxWG-CTERM-specific)